MMRRDEQAVFALRELYEKYGYSRYKMSRFEEYDLYVNNKDFLISDQVITFTDKSGRLLAMKPDVTLSIIKNAPDVKGEIQKVYYNENVYRVSGGQYREIMQTGLECIGDLGRFEIAEAVLLAAKSLKLISDNFVLDISHMGLISEVIRNSGLSQNGIENALEYLQSKNAHQMAKLCSDEGLESKNAEKLKALIELCGDADHVLNTLDKTLTAQSEKEKLSELKELCTILSSCGFGENIRIDFSVGSDLKYYSGVVFKGYVEGIPAGVLSGGQYDKLLKKMGRKSKAIGFAVYTDLLERLDKITAARVYDTIILHDKKADTATIIALTEKHSSSGSVLVCTSLPQHKNYKKLIRFENGVVNEVE